MVLRDVASRFRAVGSVAAVALVVVACERVQAPNPNALPPRGNVELPADDTARHDNAVLPPDAGANDAPDAAPLSVPVAGAEKGVRAISAQARRCYNEALQRNEAQQGRIGLRIEVGPEGDVLRVEIANQGLDLGLAACVAAAARAQKFAPDPHRGMATISTSFNFKKQE